MQPRQLFELVPEQLSPTPITDRSDVWSSAFSFRFGQSAPMADAELSIRLENRIRQERYCSWRDMVLSAIKSTDIEALKTLLAEDNGHDIQEVIMSNHNNTCTEILVLLASDRRFKRADLVGSTLLGAVGRNDPEYVKLVLTNPNIHLLNERMVARILRETIRNDNTDILKMLLGDRRIVVSNEMHAEFIKSTDASIEARILLSKKYTERLMLISEFASQYLTPDLAQSLYRR